MASSSNHNHIHNQILAQIQYAEQLGLVSDQLGKLYAFKEDYQYQYLENCFTRFIHDTANRFAGIEALLNSNVVDFYNVAELSLLIIGSTLSIGAVRMTKACRNLRLAADNCSKDGCVQSLEVVKREFAAVRPHLDAILQIERGTSL